jgi:hypothetical protein
MNYTYVASGIAILSETINVDQLNCVNLFTQSNLSVTSSFANTFVTNYANLFTQSNLAITGSFINALHVAYNTPLGIAYLADAAFYSFKNFQQLFYYYPFGGMTLWNTGVDVDKIRYFANVYRRYGPIISPTVDNNQPYTII